ncbi:hypothetical protein DMX11_19125 [Pseudomonas sp. LB-090624]|uniref:AfsA-related hotdog domain-containing protein n=1 Tax=Pseudomonas sp. LB-090624 TaxID=2213079 RepID=UPI000D92B536|nr:AfsA-related hotdog domain-containing protein [Pseudomonas sp. LB-090624]PYB72023.1 hypothetical protein DMX11_19125 [Pseudomonas sp. LB-090624]
MDRQLPLTPQVLHKGTTEDVLLSGFQDILPARLTVAEHELLCTALDSTGLEALHHSYRCHPSQGWVLVSVPAFISEQDWLVVNGFEMDVKSFYERRDDGYHLSAPWLPRQVEHYLQRHYGLPVVAQAQVALLADRLYALPGWGRANLSSYTLMNDTNNYFFYNKPHEHVPGLMLIEVARQAMYHYFYSHSGYRRGDVSISIEDLSVSFSNYTESTYAVEVVVQHTAGEKRYQPRTVDKTAEFYQNGSLVTTLRLRGSAMKMPLFKRMRTLNFPEHHWFAPSNRVLPQVLLQTAEGMSIEARLEHVSLRAVRFSGVNLDAGLQVRQLSIYVKDTGFLSFPIANCQPSRHSGVEMALFAKLDRATLSTLKEVIKCHCFHEPLQDYAAVIPASNDAQASLCSWQNG